MIKRQFTIMVLPDAQGAMRQFQVSGAHIVGALALVGVLAIVALAFPVLALWGHGVSSDLETVSGERDRLVERAAEVETTITELRSQLDLFEKRTQKLAMLAGLEMPSLGVGAQGYARGVESMTVEARAAVMRSEAEDLAGLGSLLERRLETIERAYDQQSEKLSRIPSILPVRGLFGSSFGWRRDPFTGLRQFHRGLDITAPEGTPVRAPADGIVVKTERNGGYGKVLYLSHGEGLMTRFGHLSDYKARPGAKVRRGDLIGLVGNTGRSTGPHLHYEVLVHGKQVDPMRYVSEEGLFY